jgi:hypothetical protein
MAQTMKDCSYLFESAPPEAMSWTQQGGLRAGGEAFLGVSTGWPAAKMARPPTSAPGSQSAAAHEAVGI